MTSPFPPSIQAEITSEVPLEALPLTGPGSRKERRKRRPLADAAASEPFSGTERLLALAQRRGPDAALRVADVRALAEEAERLCGTGRARPALAAALREIERDRQMSGVARAQFQDLLGRLGVLSSRPIGLPVDDRPFWLRGLHPLAGFASSSELPKVADVVVIGAGLTGSSAAYHLAQRAALGLRVILLERGDPVCEASGRNGGHFELLPENSVGIYEGLARERRDFIRRVHRGLPREVIQAEGERQASLVLGLALRNRDRLKEIVAHEQIDCDFSPRGWLYIASSEEEEQGICDEVTLAALHGQRIEIWSRGKILAEFGFRSEYVGRFIPGDGTYHPFKYACGILQAALRLGVGLYTRVAVRAIDSPAPDIHSVITDRGTIVARRVIVATNAFTSEVLPELGAIRARQSQIMVTEHAPDFTRGRIVTSESGPVFLSQPRTGAGNGRAPLLLGGGEDRPMRNPASRRRSLKVHRKLLQLRDAFYPELKGQPPSAEWIGPMGFTPDQLPVIGFLRPGLIVTAGFNGYGGSYTTAAGQAAAEMVLSDAPLDWVPEDTFSPRRFLDEQPLFLSAGDGLWRIAVALCRRLKAVNEELTYELRFGSARPRAPRRSAPRSAVPGTAGPGHSVAPEALRAFPLFERFGADELRQLLEMMRRWDVPAGTLLFEEGDPGGSCYVIVSGSVEVSTRILDADAELATLRPGSLFGQVSAVLAEPRTATCRIRRDAVLLEMERGPCEALLRSGSETALKFLAAFNQSLITALQVADRRLLRLRQEEHRPTHAAEERRMQVSLT